MSAEAVLGQLEGMLPKLETVVPGMHSQVRTGVRQINSLLDSAPPWFQGFLDDLLGWLDFAVDWVWEQLQWIGNWITENVWPVIKGPWTLWRSGALWTEEVYNKVTSVSGNVQRDQTQLEDYWKGPAATQYRATVGAQREVADKVAEIISKTRETIQNLAVVLAGIYIGIIAALIGGALLYAAGTAASTTIVGIPVGIVSWIGGTLLTVGGLMAGAVAINELLGGAAQTFSTLLELKSDNSVFQNGRWRRATKDIGDGSMSDGNSSKWQYQE